MILEKPVKGVSFGLELSVKCVVAIYDLFKTAFIRVSDLMNKVINKRAIVNLVIGTIIQSTIALVPGTWASI